MTEATTVCPICKSSVKPLHKTNDTDGFDCPRHGKFRVSRTTVSTKSGAPPEQWEAAFKTAKAHTAANESPVIQDADF